MSQASFQRRQREKARQEKAAAKRARREERKTESDEPDAEAEPIDEAALLAELAEIHRKFADEEITFEEFEEAKEGLMQRLV